MFIIDYDWQLLERHQKNVKDKLERTNNQLNFAFQKQLDDL